MVIGYSGLVCIFFLLRTSTILETGNPKVHGVLLKIRFFFLFSFRFFPHFTWSQPVRVVVSRFVFPVSANPTSTQKPQPDPE
jgi:hypothetical protein